MRTSLLWILALGLGLSGDAAAEVKRLVIGGEAHPWQETGKITAFDVVSGALQSREYRPYNNILLTLDKRDEEGVIWLPYGRFEDLSEDLDYVPGEDPRDLRYPLAYSHLCLIHPNYFDGSDTTGDDATRDITSPRRYDYAFAFDTGLPVRVNRFVFYPCRKLDGLSFIPEQCDLAGRPYTESYMRAYQVSAGMKGVHRDSPAKEPLEIILSENSFNYESTMEIAFPIQIFRGFKLRPTGPLGFTLAEIELYGEGFAPEAWYTSEVIDLKGPVNFGRIFWDIKKLRWTKEWKWNGPTRSEDFDLKRRVVPGLWEEVRLDPEPVAWEEAPVSISVEVRTGKDDSPKIYYAIDDIGDEKGEVVTRKEYLKLKHRPWSFDYLNSPVHGLRGVIAYDDENWSFWTPIPASGLEVTAPDGRRYVQFRVKVFSDDRWVFGRLNSVSIECSATLAKEVVGEVCVQGEPAPPGGVCTVEAGEDTTFLYAVRALQGRFDAVRIVTPTVPTFEGLWMGRSLQKVKEDSVVEGNGYLEVYLPRRVNRDNDPVQVAFRAAVLAYGSQFYGEVWDTEREDLLPQGIVSGDAVDEIRTNQLQVFVTKASLKVLTGVLVRPEVITPNQDGANDHATITYTLSLVTGGAEVGVGVYDLTGSEVWARQKEVRGSAYKVEVRWEGMDKEGKLVRPGVYFCRVRVKTDTGEFQEVRPITVVY